MTGRERFKKYKFLINILKFILKLIPNGISVFLFKMFRNTNGNIGLILRFLFLERIAKEVGENVSIAPGCFLLGYEHLRIMSNVSIHSMCYIDATGGLLIGDNVSIAHSSTILTTEHTWADNNSPIKYNPVKYENVKIENDVWIGCGVRILSGVEIGSRSIVAAGAIVTKNVDSNSIVGGVPATKIKDI